MALHLPHRVTRASASTVHNEGPSLLLALAIAFFTIPWLLLTRHLPMDEDI